MLQLHNWIWMTQNINLLSLPNLTYSINLNQQRQLLGEQQPLTPPLSDYDTFNLAISKFFSAFNKCKFYQI